MSNFGLYGCMHMHQPTDIHTHTQWSRRWTRGELEVRVCVLCMGVNGGVLFLPLYVAFGTQTQVARLVWQSPFAYLVTLQALLSFLERVSLGSTG